MSDKPPSTSTASTLQEAANSCPGRLISADADNIQHNPSPPAQQVTTFPKATSADKETEEDPPNPADDSLSPPYSVFRTSQKRAIVLAASFCAFLSPLTGSIYIPALNVIAADFNTTTSVINVTVTTYLGLAPTFIAGFSDGAGRRPAYFVCFVVYIAANIGLGAQNSYAALLVLRMVQSAGSSGTVALATGVAADVVSTSERGSYIGLASLGAWLGPILGSVLGGIISQYLGWHWDFWFLAILASCIFILMMLFFPETNHNVVGDGSYPPPRWNQSITSARMAASRRKQGLTVDPEKQQTLRSNYKLKFPNPLATLAMVGDKVSGIILLGNGLVVGTTYAIPVGVSEIFHEKYNFNQIQIALSMLPFSAGAIISTIIFGRLIDFNYKRHAVRLGVPVVKNRRQDIGDFPIERARFEVGLPALCLGMAVTIAYGWVLNANVSMAGPLVLLFFIGLSTTGAYQVLSTIMIDNYANQAATATAASNLFRCWMGAALTSAIAPMLHSWGAGWTYTFFALLWAAYSPLCLLLVRNGVRWRRERREKHADGQ
ncbi:Itaconate transport protein [Lachnellula willkommii]|uniref:Itaconate transport protein n=1 Tax=Lachnellula willkommii TaxID=215461 RepID=A0A559M3H8_9HELO|nr:Itaconate transport protein [Lachnellula willkommii]